jgi:malonyl CoA-acyl carrier protein transacylase
MTNAPVLLFPGQGSQTDGMRDAVERALPDLLAQAIELIGADPFERVTESTAYAQPAIFLAGLAHFEELGRPRASAFAGHSMGELTALVAAGSLSPTQGLRLIVARSSLMADAAAIEGGGMLAVLKATPEAALELASNYGLSLANDNAPGQIVLAGRTDDLDVAARAARKLGMRAMRLDVAGAFHHRSMRAACIRFREELLPVHFRPASAPVYSGLRAAPFEDVQAELALAVTRPVRWRETLLALDAAGHDTFLDMGPGQVLAGLVRRTLPDARVLEFADAHA